MVFWKFFIRRSKDQIVQAGLDKRKFRELTFKHSWNNLVRAYDLRMFFIHQSPHTQKALQYTWEVEKLHHELQYQSARTGIIRFLLFAGAIELFYTFYELPKMFDWAETQEPKHQTTVYLDLEEGGEEGEE